MDTSAVRLIAAAITKANSADPQKIQQAMQNVSLETPEGEYKYSATDHAGLNVDDVAITVVKNGAFTLTEWSKQQLSTNLK